MDSAGDISRYRYEGGIDLGTLKRRPGPGFGRATFVVARRGSP
jgi:hypothetical protein